MFVRRAGRSVEQKNVQTTPKGFAQNLLDQIRFSGTPKKLDEVTTVRINSVKICVYHTVVPEEKIPTQAESIVDYSFTKGI